MADPLVTVIAMCYNHEKYLEEGLEAIRTQTFQDFELIITDDASKDQSVKKIGQWIEKHQLHCQLIAHEENRGICKTLNEALSQAKGKYISIVSVDDIWAVDKLKHQVKQMESLPEEVGVMYSDCKIVDESKNLLEESFIKKHLRGAPHPSEDNLIIQLLRFNFVPALSMLIRRRCYDVVGFYDENLAYEDWDMHVRLALQFKFAFSPHTAGSYRILKTSHWHSLTGQFMDKVLLSDFQTYCKILRSPSVKKEIKKEAAYQMYHRACAVQFTGRLNSLKYTIIALYYSKKVSLVLIKVLIKLLSPLFFIKIVRKAVAFLNFWMNKLNAKKSPS